MTVAPTLIYDPGSGSRASGASHARNYEMARQAIIQSRCECQSTLYAALNEDRHVITGWAREPRRGRQVTCPAHSIGAERPQFEVAWLCPYCNRNTLRVFYAGALTYRAARLSEAPPPRSP